VQAKAAAISGSEELDAGVTDALKDDANGLDLPERNFEPERF
jgi:hypothetical protein